MARTKANKNESAPSPIIKIDRAALFEDLKYTPHEGQMLVHNSTARYRVLACGVRWGKTTCSTMEAIVEALTPRVGWGGNSVGWVVGPNYGLADRCFAPIIEKFQSEPLRSEFYIDYRKSENTLRVKNLAGGISTIVKKSADNPEQLLGEGLDWVICDEASRLKPTIWNSYLSQRLIDKRGKALLISTPKGKGWFYETWKRGVGADRDANYESWNAPSWQNPILNRNDIEAERAKIAPREFRQEYEAQFLDGGGQVFTNIDLCMKVKEWSAPEPGMTYFAGLDLAKSEDWTVMVVIDRTGRVVFVERMRRMEWDRVIPKVRGISERYNNAQTWVDSTGKGEPIFEQLKRSGMNCRPYHIGATSREDLINNLILKIEGGKLELPTREFFPEGVGELEDFEYSENGKAEVPKGRHDDFVFALALAAWPIRSIRSPLVMVV